MRFPAAHPGFVPVLLRWFAVVGLAVSTGATRSLAEVVLDEPPYQWRFSNGGTLLAVTRGRRSLTGATPAIPAPPALQLRLGGLPLTPNLERPRPGPDGGWIIASTWGTAADLRGELRLRSERRGNAVILRRQWRLRSTQALRADLSAVANLWPTPLPPTTWLPLENGTGDWLGAAAAAEYFSAGRTPPTRAPGPLKTLGLPLVSHPLSATPTRAREHERVTWLADPWFSTRFEGTDVQWEYPGAVGLEAGEEVREFDVVLHDGDADAAVNLFFSTALPAVPPGPEWLHRIRWVGYDYLSDGGDGWFRDLDAMTQALRSAERRRTFVCLHGWYDVLGRYTFDAAEGRLDREWTAFPEAARVHEPVPPMNLEGDLVDVGFTRAQSVPMSTAKVHERLRYAKQRGYRVGLYFADGLSAGADLPGFDPHEVLSWGGWRGPDSRGRTYCRNPLVPAVRDFYVRYLRALLEEYGEDLDGLVWDETFHVPQGSLGATDGMSPAGYADRAMLRLTDELRSVVDRYNVVHRREVAFLVSDCAGMPFGFRPPSTALWAHGTYQDSHFRPGPWSYAVFPNYRNVAWSCCWWPLSKWAWVEQGVREHQAPVPVTNGWGDDTGFSEMTDAQRDRVLALFRSAGRSRVRFTWTPAVPGAPGNSLPR